VTYVIVAGALLTLAAVVAVIGLRSLPPALRSGHLIASLAGASGLVVLTAVFDTIMIRVGLVAYSDAHIVGARVGLAPLEDFSYPLACALALPAVWALVRRRGDGD
jgi:lycopene cyclase domain-containing protein